MPKVTVDPGQYEKFDLKSAPPDGFVELRPLPYGMKLSRRSKATKMMMKTQAPKKGQKPPDEQTIELESMDEWAAVHDFAYCIGDHNLEDNAGNKLDFTNPMTLKLLDPKVGSEIERLIDELNNEEGEETLEDFLARSTSSLEAETPSLAPVGGVAMITPEK